MTAHEEYLGLLAEVDEKTARLSGLPGVSLGCAASCAQCCLPFSLLAVEANSLLLHADSWRARAVQHPARCPLLTAEGLCSVYEVRPLICRFRGFPVDFMDPEGNPLRESCENNIFPSDLGGEGAIRLELWNTRLYRINVHFCTESGSARARVWIRDVVRSADRRDHAYSAAESP
jgi:hypothetical protein